MSSDKAKPLTLHSAHDVEILRALVAEARDDQQMVVNAAGPVPQRATHAQYEWWWRHRDRLHDLTRLHDRLATTLALHETARTERKQAALAAKKARAEVKAGGEHPEHPKVLIVLTIAARRCVINGMRSTAPRWAWAPVAEFMLGENGHSLSRFSYRAANGEAAVAFEILNEDALRTAARAATSRCADDEPGTADMARRGRSLQPGLPHPVQHGAQRARHAQPGSMPRLAGHAGLHRRAGPGGRGSGEGVQHGVG